MDEYHHFLNLKPFEKIQLRGCLVSEIFLGSCTVALSFVYGNYCSTMTGIALKNLSRQLMKNYTINFFVYLHLMLHIYVTKFNVMEHCSVSKKILVK